jgi:hypothetical protein
MYRFFPYVTIIHQSNIEYNKDSNSEIRKAL